MRRRTNEESRKAGIGKFWGFPSRNNRPVFLAGRTRGLNRFQHGLLGGLPVGEATHVLRGELTLVRREQPGHLTGVVGDAGAFPDRWRVIANPNDQGTLPSRPPTLEFG